MQARTFEQEIEQMAEYEQERREREIADLSAHRSACAADDCLCHDPIEGEEVADGHWEPTGTVTGYDRNGEVMVEWEETQWVQSYPRSRFSWAIDHWQLMPV